MPGTIGTDGFAAPVQLPSRRLLRPDGAPPPAGGPRPARTGGAGPHLGGTPARRRLTPARRRLTAAATVALWAGSAVSWTLLSLHTYRTDTGLGWDLVTSWRAEVAFAHGRQPYSLAATGGRLFLYPPSSLLLMRPLALLSLHEVQLLGLLATAILSWAAVMVTAAALGRRPWDLTAAAVVLALCFAQPMVAELGLENVTVVCTLGLASFFLLAERNHFVAAGAVVGLTLALKPLLLPLLLIFVLARRWRGLALAVAIPAVLNLLAFAVVPDPSEVFAKLPSLLDRSGSGVLLNSAWVDVLRSFEVPHAFVVAIRLVTVAVVLAAAWLSWKDLTDPRLRLVTTASLLLIGAYLAGTLSENHFMLTLVPLAMTGFLPRAPMRKVAAWIGVLLFMGLTPPGSLLGLGSEANLSAYRAFGMMLTVLTVLAVLARRRRARAGLGGVAAT